MIKLNSYQIYKELFNEVYPGDPPKEASEFKSINDFARELSSLKRVQVDKAKQDFVQELSSRTVGDNSFNALVESLEPQGLSRNSMETIGPLVEYLKRLLSAIDDLKGSLANEDRKNNIELLESSIKEGDFNQEALENEKAYAKIEESPESYRDLLGRSDRFNIEITDEVKKALESDDFISNFFRKVGSSSFLSAFNGMSTDDIKEALEVVMKGQSSIDAAIIDRPTEDTDVINLTSDSPEYVQQAYEKRKERDEKEADISKFEKLETLLSGDQTKIENLMEQTSQIIQNNKTAPSEGESTVNNYAGSTTIDWNQFTNEGSAYSESLVQQISNLREDLVQTSQVIREYYNTVLSKESIVEGQTREYNKSETTSEVKKEDVKETFKESFTENSSEKKEEKTVLKEIKEKLTEKSVKATKDAGQRAIDAAKKQSKLMAIQTGRMVGSTMGLDLGPMIASLFTNPYVLAGIGVLAALLGIDMATTSAIREDNQAMDASYSSMSKSERAGVDAVANAMETKGNNNIFPRQGDTFLAEGSYNNMTETGSKSFKSLWGDPGNLGFRVYQVKRKGSGKVEWVYSRPHEINREYTSADQRRDAQVIENYRKENTGKSADQLIAKSRYYSKSDLFGAYDNTMVKWGTMGEKLLKKTTGIDLHGKGVKLARSAGMVASASVNGLPMAYSNIREDVQGPDTRAIQSVNGLIHEGARASAKEKASEGKNIVGLTYRQNTGNPGLDNAMNNFRQMQLDGSGKHQGDNYNMFWNKSTHNHYSLDKGDTNL